MGFHTFDVDGAERLERADRRYRYLSAEELLWAVDPTPSASVVDLGSGTGFYTDDVAPATAALYAVDVQAEMHEFYREKGVPDNVSLVTARVADLPFATDAIDAAFSTMTYHEFASDAAVREVSRVLAPGAQLAIVDWAATGSGEAGPPLDERFSAEAAVDILRDAGFTMRHTAVRPETFLLVADND